MRQQARKTPTRSMFYGDATAYLELFLGRAVGKGRLTANILPASGTFQKQGLVLSFKPLSKKGLVDGLAPGQRVRVQFLKPQSE